MELVINVTKQVEALEVYSEAAEWEMKAFIDGSRQGQKARFTAPTHSLFYCMLRYSIFFPCILAFLFYSPYIGIIQSVQTN